MVQHDIEHYRQAMAVRGVDKGFKIVRRAVGGMRRVEQHAVVAPAAVAAKLGERHHFNHRYAKFGQTRQLIDSGAEGAFRRKGAHVHLIDHTLFPRAAFPGGVLPGIAGGIDHQRGAVNVRLLRARGGIRHHGAVGENKIILCAGRHAGGLKFEPAVADRLHFCLFT